MGRVWQQGNGSQGEGRGGEVSSFSRDIGELLAPRRVREAEKGVEFNTGVGEDSGDPLGLLVGLGIVAEIERRELQRGREEGPLAHPENKAANEHLEIVISKIIVKRKESSFTGGNDGVKGENEGVV